MSFSVPDNPGYFDTIQVCFMELTGRSVMFSGRDLELLVEWREQGASATAICKGLRDAVEAMPDRDPPRDVFACRDWVEPHVERAKKRGVGGHDDSDGNGDGETSTPSGLFGRALDKIERAGRDCDDDAIRQVYRRAWKRVRELSEDNPPDRFERLTAVEEGLVEGFYRALDQADRQNIEERIASEQSDLLDGMTTEAKREHLRARRRRVLMDEYDLVSLIE